MFTTIKISPKDAALFASSDRFDTPELREYAIGLVADLQSAIDRVCDSGKIDDLSDDTSIEFQFRSQGRLWSGSIWVSIYDDLPGCPVKVNCAVAHYDETVTHETLIGTMPDERYETFEVETIDGYSRSDVYQIKREWQAKEVQAYVKGYASGQESMARGFHLEPRKGNLLK